MDERIGFAIYQPVGTVGVLDVCLCLGFGGIFFLFIHCIYTSACIL